MADNAVRVAVLDGDFARLTAMGLPMAISVQLQQMALKLSDALWTAKNSNSGFSVSLYWPSSDLEKIKKSSNFPLKRRRKRRKKSKVINSS